MFTTAMHILTRSRTRTAPSGYEKLRVPFHGLRTAQLVSSLVVGAIMSFFMYHLTHDDWATPWTFIVLATVSLLTVAALIITILLHCLVGLNPIFNIAFNSFLAGLWAMGFGMLAYYMWPTLTHYCSVTYWHDNTGVMVCRIYKAVFTFSLLGLVSTLAALALDLHIRNLAHQGGRHFRLADLDQKRRSEAPLGGIRGAYADDDVHGEDDEREDEAELGRHSDAFDVPGRGYGARYAGGVGVGGEGVVTGATGLGLGFGSAGRGGGYAVPEGQFEYDGDTSYRGFDGGVHKR